MISVKRISRFYDKFNQPAEPTLRHKNIARLAGKLKVKGAILDIGCGKSPLLEAIGRNSKDIIPYGIDVSFRNAKFSRDKGFKALQAASEKLPFKKGFFDAIFFMEVYEHVINKDSAMEEIHRVLKRNGLLFMTTPNKFWVLPYIPILRGNHKRIYQIVDGKFSPFRIYKKLRQKGFRIIDRLNSGPILGPKYDTESRFGLYNLPFSFLLTKRIFVIAKKD